MIGTAWSLDGNCLLLVGGIGAQFVDGSTGSALMNLHDDDGIAVHRR